MSLRVGVEAYALSIRRTGIGHYIADLLCAAAAADPSLALRALIFPDEPNGPARTDDLCEVGIDLRVPRRLTLRAYLKALRWGMPLPLSLLVGRCDAMLLTNYRWYPTGRTPTMGFVYDLGYQACPECIDPGFADELGREVPRLVERCDLIATISDAVAAELRATFEGIGRRLVVLRPGVPAHIAGPAPTDASERLARLKLAPGYLLHVGTLEPRKNLVRLIEAHRRLPAAPPLVLVGTRGWSDGPIAEAIAAAGPRVLWLQYVDAADLRALYDGAALLVFPTRYEGFGLPVAEAMSTGTPVACSDLPVLREVAGDAATYFDPLDPDAIAAAVAALLADPARCAAQSAAGRTRAAGLTWDAAGRGLLEALRRLAPQ